MEGQPQPSLELPKPLSPVETSPSQGTSEKQAPARLERKQQVNSPPPAGTRTQAKPVADSVNQLAPHPAPAPTHPVSQGNPVIADDVDLIEKEWVTKAKQIVTRNRQDPYQQNKELTVFRADYMKKRYGKEIKLEKS